MYITVTCYCDVHHRRTSQMYITDVHHSYCDVQMYITVTCYCDVHHSNMKPSMTCRHYVTVWYFTRQCYHQRCQL